MTAIQRRVLLASRDPGSANMLVGLHWLMNGGGSASLLEDYLTTLNLEADAKLTVRAWGPAVKVWQDYGAESIAAEPGEGSIEDEIILASNWLEQVDPHVVVTGLDDVDAVRTRALWVSAREKRIPIIVLADNETFLFDRCFDLDRVPFEPEMVVVSSQAARSGFETGMFPLEKLFVLPNLAQERIKSDDQSYNDLRKDWGAAKHHTVILFVSLVGAEMIEKGRIPPFDEKKMLDDLLEALSVGQLGLPDGPAIQDPFLIIRPHPREDISKFSWLETAKFPFPVIVSRAGRPKDAIYSTDWVAGRRSGVVDEAILRQARVYLMCD
ncbi:hypothetical protein [Thalassospira povalilytica]|uniref:hypothetical protein n=1 Tax=Thalassospira povalilytica TaxID=732237 RepID=UPI001D183168|nr:hypothetical protein [Thalassospira povalilytica]MCC4241911.1 hypothetical protein [Thalassospira povalilytica]